MDPMTQVPVTPGDEIRRMRLDVGMTQTQFAKAIGISRQTLSFWELGTREPSISQWRHIVAFWKSQLSSKLTPVPLPAGQLELSYTPQAAFALVRAEP